MIRIADAPLTGYCWERSGQLLNVSYHPLPHNSKYTKNHPHSGCAVGRALLGAKRTTVPKSAARLNAVSVVLFPIRRRIGIFIALHKMTN